MRVRVIDAASKSVLVSRIGDTEQAGDLSAPTNCDGVGRVRHFRTRTAPGWPDNPLPISPAARWLGLPTADAMNAQVFQLAACAWRCWYCYVPYGSLRADPMTSNWWTAEQLVDAYLRLDDRSPILDLSGGSPDLAPEWVLWTLEAIGRRGAASSTFVWSDDNLSSARLLADSGLLRGIASYPNYGRACCLKGYDAASFAFNTRAAEDGFDGQLRILDGYAKTDIDLYVYVPLVGPPGGDARLQVESVLDRLAAVRSDLPSRAVPLIISSFGPMQRRLRDEHDRALRRQWELVEHWKAIAPKFLLMP